MFGNVRIFIYLCSQNSHDLIRFGKITKIHFKIVFNDSVIQKTKAKTTKKHIEIWCKFVAVARNAK